MITNGLLLRGLRALIFSSTRNPLRPGRIMSRITRSGWFFSPSWTALLPSLAVSMVAPVGSKAACMLVRMSLSSSTSRIRLSCSAVLMGASAGCCLIIGANPGGDNEELGECAGAGSNCQAGSGRSPINPKRMSPSAPIAVLDSGVGGLTVVKALRQQMPHEDVIYFGDTARVPYGPKTGPTVTSFVRQIVRYLNGYGPKHVVIACNTA